MSMPKLATMRLYVLAVSVLLSMAVQECAAQRSSGDHSPLVAPLAKDPATSLYTISIKDGGAPLVIDLAGPLVWSTCPPAHQTFPCGSRECAAANGVSSPLGCDNADDGTDGGRHDNRRPYCSCTAHPCRPTTSGRPCATGDLTTFAMSANATDGRSTLYPVSFTAVGACAPDRLLRSLPAGAAGVAGFGRAALSLPSQLAARRGFGRRFAVCLPGVVVFGSTPIYLKYYPVELTATIAFTPLAKNPRRGGYYLPVKDISVVWDGVTTPASLPPRALEIDAWTGRGGVTLSTVQRYTTMRADVYRPFIRAFNASIGKPGYVKSVAAVAPFELCYDTYSLRRLKRTGWNVPTIHLELGAGASMNWMVNNGNSMVQMGDRTVCLAFVEMGPEAGYGTPAPAVVIGTYQLEDNLLVFDEDKEVLHFSGLLWGSGATCSGFNFTLAS
ncbi:chitinase CLP-like [Phragmites australis]|uniref:chitinase CLP-like n=1 Tax=Phragmites australis TaxID=29695 RepID=UPI002D789D4D|nr:chitinase CLP-like [Phragmites australis]